jgi:hypothetical protein
MKIETKCSACKLSWHPDKPCDAIFSLEQFQTIRAAGIEEENWDNIETFAPKCILSAKQYRAKGVPRKKQREYIETGRAEFELPYKFSEAATFFDRGNTKNYRYGARWKKKTAQITIKKNYAGNDIFPCVLTMFRF